MERTKRIDSQTLIAVILSLLLVASLLLTATGAWFKSTLDEIDGETADFGTIVLGEDDADLALNMTETDVLMPGDDIDVDFDVVNSGTADMYVRFKLIFETDDAEYVTGTTGATITANDGELDEVVYYRHDFGAEGFWYVRADASIGSLTPALNETDVIDETFLVPSDTSNSAQGTDVTISLYIQAIQSANNGSIDDPENAGYDVTWQEYTGPVESGLSLLSITSSEPTNDGTDYAITNISELGYIAEQTNLDGDWSAAKVFTLSGDVDLAGYEWVPIGTDDEQFKGTFDGDDNTITNMTITEYAIEIGLFGGVDGATIENINVAGSIDIEVEDSTEGCGIAGIAAAVMSSTITNCYSDVDITVDANATFTEDAGICIGGVIGMSASDTVSNCYNTGDIDVETSVGGGAGEAVTYVGGIIGMSGMDTVSNCYNIGDITYDATIVDIIKVGGAFGATMDMGTNSLTNCYTVGSLTNNGLTTTTEGAMIGETMMVTVSGSYYNNEVSNLGTAGVGVDSMAMSTLSITGATTVQMQTEATYTGWNFTTIWDIDPLVNNGYPTLR